MHVKEAEKQLLLFLREEQLKRGENPNAHPYLYRWPNRARSGVRVSELGWSSAHAGSAFMQSDVPHGLLVCAAAERLLLDLCDEEAEEVEDSKWRLVQAIWPDEGGGNGA